jgi:membrane-bound lytic murein transglycosylase B
MSVPRQELSRRLAGFRPGIGKALLAGLLVCSGLGGAWAQSGDGGRRESDSRTAERTDGDYASRADVREFVRDMAARHGFNQTELLQLFSQVRHQARVVSLMTPAPPGTKRSWANYRARTLDPVRVEAGLLFWRDNQEAVRRASERFGVPPEIIVSIIGIETMYGRYTGNFRVLDTLATLAFDYPRRAEFFRSELEHFLLLTRDQRLDPLGPRGSYAGAIGVPQFMPGSIRRHAIDFDGDGRIDLMRNNGDAIGSVASFLANHGWRPGEPTHFQARLADESKITPLIDAGIEPRFTIAQLGSYGVSSPQKIPPAMPLALIDLPNGDDPTSYYLGATNFYVITRYNRSSFYAMAVIDLASELRSSRQ